MSLVLTAFLTEFQDWLIRV